LETLCPFHEQMLSQMEEAIANADRNDSANLGAVFLSLVNFLKMYTLYCNGYKKSLEILTKCEKDNSAFPHFVKAIEQKPECNGLHLRDYLIKPIQRLCKYPLLFKELLSVTPQNLSDYSLVLQTCEKLNSVTQSVNENAAEILNFQKLLLFNKSVSGYEADIGSFWYIRDEILHDSITGRNRHVYLMAHTLIITKIPRSMSDKIIRGKREKFISAIDIEHIELQPLNSESELVFLVNDDSEKRTYKWNMPNASSRLSWYTDLTEAIENVTQGFKAPRNRFHVVNTSSSRISTLRRAHGKREIKTKKIKQNIYDTRR